MKRVIVAIFAFVSAIEVVEAESFFRLVETASPSEVQAALKTNGKVDERDVRGVTPLMYAAMSNPNREVISVLLKAGAKVNDRDVRGVTPLMYAVRRVTITRVYFVEDHGESRLLYELTEQVEMENFVQEDLSLLTAGAIPEDGDMLVFLSPQQDLLPDEEKLVLDYLDRGGKAFFAFDRIEKELPRFDNVLKSYGLKVEDSFVFEGDSNQYLPSQPYVLIPIMGSHQIVSQMAVAKLIMILPLARPISTLDIRRRGLEIEPVLTSSGKAYSKVFLIAGGLRSPVTVVGPITERLIPGKRSGSRLESCATCVDTCSYQPLTASSAR